MPTAYQIPGVYQNDVVQKPAPILQTGVPGFLGFVRSECADQFTEAILLNNIAEFATQVQPYLQNGNYLGDAVNGFFLNGGGHCYVAAAGFWSDHLNMSEQALEAALSQLAPLTDLDLIAAPDAMRLTDDSGSVNETLVKKLQRQMLDQCERQGDRFAILDSLPTDAAGVKQQRQDVSEGFAEPINGALYYPWLVLLQESGDLRLVPSSGHVAGIFARSDAKVGVFKAPANEEILGVLNLGADTSNPLTSLDVNDQLQSALNPEGINCVRAFPGRGIRVWGARSLSHDSEWRYVNVCRLIVTVRRWIDLNMTWVVFEPNTPPLWIRIVRQLAVYLSDLWQAGGLFGQTPDEAFYIKCDSDTNTQECIAQGQVVTEIGLAPSVPGEFVVVRVVQQTNVEPR